MSSVSTTNTSTGQQIRTRAIIGAMMVAVGIGGLGLVALILTPNFTTTANQGTSAPVTLTGVIQYVDGVPVTNQPPFEQAYLLTTTDHVSLNIPNTVPMPPEKSSVVVTGQPDGDAFDVASLTVQSDQPAKVPATTTSKNVSALSVTPTDYNVLVVMGYYPGQSVPTIPTPADAQAQMFGPAPSVTDYYTDNSFGKIHVTGRVMGWLPLSGPETSNIWGSGSLALQAAKAADPTIDFSQYQQLVFISPFTNVNLPDGYSLEGPTILDSPDGPFVMSINVIRSTVVGLPRSTPLNQYILVHEFGHGLGMAHAGLLACDTVPIDPSCTVWEYGSHTDVMGGGYVAGTAVDLNAPHLDELGWLDPSNIATVTGSGTYTIEPLENRTTGLKVIKIPRGNNDYLYLEYRQPIGYDLNMESSTQFQGVLLNVLDTGYTSTYGASFDTVMIDPNPPAWITLDALAPGHSLTDPATGAVVTVTSINSSGATVQIQGGTVRYVPSISMPTPTYGGAYTHQVPFTANASSPAGISHVDFYLKDAATPFATDYTAPYSATFDGSAYPDGTMYGYVLATGNDGGRASTAPTPFLMSSTAGKIVPSISMPTPSYGGTYGSPVNFTANASSPAGIDHVDFFVTEQSSTIPFATDTAAPYSATFDASAYPGGTTLHGFVLATGGDGGRASTAPIPFVISGAADTQPPTVTVTNPVDGSILGGTNVGLGANINDNVGVSTSRFYIDCTSGILSNCGFTYVGWPYQLVKILSVGSHTLQVSADDYAGHTTISPVIHFTVDGSAPSVSLTSPLNLATVSGTISISSSASDDIGVARVNYSMDSITNIFSSSSVSPFTATYNTAVLSNGLHTLYAQAVDRVGKTSGFASRLLTVSNGTAVTPAPNPTPVIPPSLTLISSSSGAITGQSGILQANGTLSGISRIDFKIDGAVVASKPTGPFTFAIESPKYPNGSHAAQAVFHYASGAVTYSNLTFTTNNPLSVTLSSPIKNALVKKTITIAPIVRGGAGVAKIQYVADGKKPLSTRTTSPFRITLNTKLLKNGAHTITAKVTDKKGKVVNVSVKVRVQN